MALADKIQDQAQAQAPSVAAPAAKLVSIPANPVPEAVTTGMLRTPDKVSIRYARWDPPQDRKGHIRSFEQYDIDMATFVQEIVLPDCPPPFYALGHSMGAAVLLRSAIMGHRWFDRMVLCAPLIRLTNMPMLSFAPALVRSLRLMGLGGRYVPGGGPESPSARPFPKN